MSAVAYWSTALFL